jgi:hypothetical protein
MTIRHVSVVDANVNVAPIANRKATGTDLTVGSGTTVITAGRAARFLWDDALEPATNPEEALRLFDMCVQAMVSELSKASY